VVLPDGTVTYSPVTLSDGVSDDEAAAIDRFFSAYRLYRQSVKKCEEWLRVP
jgi:hypothetical protein